MATKTAADRLRDAERNGELAEVDTTQPLKTRQLVQSRNGDDAIARMLAKLATAAELNRFAVAYGFQIQTIINCAGLLTDALDQLAERRLPNDGIWADLARQIEAVRVQSGGGS